MAIGFTQQAGNASEGCADEIIAGTLAERTGLAGRGNRAHHELRIDFAENVVPETHAGDDAGSEILHDDIDLRDEVED